MICWDYPNIWWVLKQGFRIFYLGLFVWGEKTLKLWSATENSESKTSHKHFELHTPGLATATMQAKPTKGFRSKESERLQKSYIRYTDIPIKHIQNHHHHHHHQTRKKTITSQRIKISKHNRFQWLKTIIWWISCGKTCLWSSLLHLCCRKEWQWKISDR